MQLVKCSTSLGNEGMATKRTGALIAPGKWVKS